MKILSTFLSAAVLSLSAATVSSAASPRGNCLSPGLNVISVSSEMTVNAVCGSPMVFEKTDFSNAYLLRDNFSITVLSLPDISTGVLKLGSGNVCVGQEIPASSVPSLKFVPQDNCEKASFSFTFDNSYTAHCNLVFTERVNFAPEILDSSPVWTSGSLSLTDYLRGTDPDGDAITYEITSYPSKGLVQLDSTSGKFEYTPYSHAVGTDSFKYRVRDIYGNYSGEAVQNVKVENDESHIVFSDMEGYPGYAAAVSLVSEGIMDMQEDGSFDPAQKMTRLEFLVCAMDAFGAGNIPANSPTEFADCNEIPKEYSGYVSSAKSLGIVKGIRENGLLYFNGGENITYAEAAVILNSILGLECEDTSSAEESVPEEAREDVCALRENGIFDKYLDVTREMDRAGCAKIVCEAMRFFD